MPLNREFLTAVTVLLGAILLPAESGSVVVSVQASHCMGIRSAVDLEKSQSRFVRATYVAAAPPTRKIAQSALSGRPFITSVSLEAGPIGALVTVRGGGFASDGNNVQFDGPVGSKDEPSDRSVCG